MRVMAVSCREVRQYVLAFYGAVRVRGNENARASAARQRRLSLSRKTGSEERRHSESAPKLT